MARIGTTPGGNGLAGDDPTTLEAILADHGAPSGAAPASSTLADQFITGQTASGQILTAVAAVPAAVLPGLSSIPGVQGVTVIHVDPQAVLAPRQNQNDVPGLASCAQLAHTPAVGRCPAGAAAASITLDLSGAETSTSQAARAWPAAAITPQHLARLPVQTIVVSTDGSAVALERARTALETAFAYLGPPDVLTGSASQSAYAELQHLTDVVILASLVIAGCSLAVSVAGGLTDRRRAFSLLRLAGTPLGVLRRVVALETALPLAVSAVVAAGTGFLASALFLRSELGESLQPPGGGYYLIVLAGRRLPRGHRLHPAATRADHRTGNRQERVTAARPLRAIVVTGAGSGAGRANSMMKSPLPPAIGAEPVPRGRTFHAPATGSHRYSASVSPSSRGRNCDRQCQSSCSASCEVQST